MSDEMEFDATETSSPVVRYSAKELFAQINKKLDVVLELAQSKASQVDLDELAAHVDAHDSRIQTLEDRGSGRLEMFKILAWVVATFLASITAFTGLGVLIFYLARG